MKRTLVWIAVLGVLVLPTVAFSEEASERVVKDDWGKGRHEEIQRLRQLKEKDPEAFKQAVQEKKTALRERLAHLKETNPEAYGRTIEKLKHKRQERLEWMKTHRPEAFEIRTGC